MTNSSSDCERDRGIAKPPLLPWEDSTRPDSADWCDGGLPKFSEGVLEESSLSANLQSV